ncbi:MAG TPA: 16S rRNA (cytosine(967)-C(5))-methyltransferase RsmB [Candidatus Binataceae bacterium]|nr:16S rRNA (cytosine(967)-C(5))-methyltransferase RsmB [Candidatus Binataceae bacterium]
MKRPPPSADANPPGSVIRRRPAASLQPDHAPRKVARSRADADAAGLAARRAALGILVRVARERAFADVLLGHRLDEFAPIDRGLITRMVLGTIAWQGRLDYELARIASRPLDSIAPELLAILRMALFQLRMLDRVPAHAAVDTAVTLARETAGGAGGSGFVNAILRNALRRPVELPPRAADENGYLAIAHSHPRWLAEKFVEWFGIDGAEALMRANNEAAPNVMRLNLARGGAEEVAARLQREGFAIAARGRFPETIMLESAPPPDSSAIREGLCYPQAAASQLVARMLAPAPGATILECAAAPGGKATHLAELVGAAGRVIAVDLNFAGLKKIRVLARRLGLRNVYPIRANAATAMPLGVQSFDYVLLDAPCTGIGTLREHPEIRWRLAPGDFARMAAMQAAMLATAAASVRPGGVLIYSVCSVAPQEGAGVIDDFLARNGEFAIDREFADAERFAGLIGADGMMRTRPDQAAMDGFFAARIKRRPTP